MERTQIGRDTTLCISLASRPGTFGSRFHNHLYDALGLNFVYKAFSTEDLPAAIAGVRALGIRGCSVSMPFKEACIPLLDALAPSARAIDSVNTIVNDAGKLTGHNTDYQAVCDLLGVLPISRDLPVLMRGSGGMAKAVASALRDTGFRNTTVVARNTRAGRALAEACGFRYAEALGPLRGALLVNVTPIGMRGGAEVDQLAFPAEAIAGADTVFDVVALPVRTPLTLAAERAGKRVLDGGSVIVLQGLAQFELYTGKTPSEAQLRAASAFALA